MLRAFHALLWAAVGACGYTELCPMRSIANAAVPSLQYSMGVLDGQPAVRFQLEVPAATWAAVGVRPAGGGAGMAGFDMFAVDAAEAKARDYAVPAGNGMPAAAAAPRTVLARYDANGGGGVIAAVERALQPAATEGVGIPLSLAVDLATASGPGGAAPAAWAQHTSRGVIRVAFTCAALGYTPEPSDGGDNSVIVAVIASIGAVGLLGALFFMKKKRPKELRNRQMDTMMQELDDKDRQAKRTRRDTEISLRDDTTDSGEARSACDSATPSLTPSLSASPMRGSGGGRGTRFGGGGRGSFAGGKGRPRGVTQVSATPFLDSPSHPRSRSFTTLGVGEPMGRMRSRSALGMKGALQSPSGTPPKKSVVIVEDATEVSAAPLPAA